MRTFLYPFPWSEEAACSPHNRKDDVSHLFFPPKMDGDARETHYAREMRERTAAAICDRCPVRRQCLRDAMPMGIWGATKADTSQGGNASPSRPRVPIAGATR